MRWDQTVPLGDGYELSRLRAELNPALWAVLYDPSQDRWIAVRGAREYVEARSADTVTRATAPVLLVRSLVRAGVLPAGSSIPSILDQQGDPTKTPLSHQR